MEIKKKKYAIRFNWFFVFIVIVLIILANFVAYMLDVNINQDDYINKWENVVTAKSDGNLNKSANIVNPVPLSSAKNADYLKKCVFVGDSDMLKFAEMAELSADSVFAGNSLSTSNLNTGKIQTQYGNFTLAENVIATKKENIYIMLGADSISTTTPEKMSEEIEKFVKNLKKETSANIYLCSIYPISSQTEQNTPTKNVTIDLYNSLLLQISNNQSVNFLDINTALKSIDGKLNPSLSPQLEFKHYILCHTR
jgi:hypothetical protein